MTVPIIRTSCRKSQVKSKNHGKTHIFQCELSILKHPVVTVINKRRKAKLWTKLTLFQVIRP